MAKFMEINGLRCRINLPNAPKGEKTHNLPPYKLQPVYNVDEYECPANWMNGSAKAASYFVAVDPGKHLWLDFNDNWHHTHHIAVVLSVQGINPLTGRKTDVLRLEQYREKCPVHDREFGADRFCKECNYKWPAQNYLSTTTCPGGLFWIDGWRAEDGRVRGFLITEETMRGVAAQVLGDDRVFAIGIAFYVSKQPKQTAPARSRPSGFVPTMNTADLYSHKMRHKSSGIGGSSLRAANFRGMASSVGGGAFYSNHVSDAPASINSVELSCSVGPECAMPNLDSAAEFGYADSGLSPSEPKMLEIAAGAKIYQELGKLDTRSLEFFEDTPAGMLYVNYVDSTAASNILKRKRDLTNGGEGFLAGLKVGN